MSEQATDTSTGPGAVDDLPEVDLTPGVSTTTADDVLEALKDVVDPELGINVVDLGLVYGVHLDDAQWALWVSVALLEGPTTAAWRNWWSSASAGPPIPPLVG